ncbi:ABC transporter substrate-binding protein [Actinospica durhamensis]|uniref:ABC transporter substrate-binding protein n=1 Tax=Actinospica durhamensis TaxID=1508375 RepID=A0A941ILJ8_9ACTN|nr:ABC transporter substrate-binding protein [Actinospica durhamensis]MBR7833100.1 ABC transporter substrate-binding protein [Actinospica durhamensis]
MHATRTNPHHSDSTGFSRRGVLRTGALGAAGLAAAPLLSACNGSSSSSGSSGSGGVAQLTMWGSFSGDQIAQINKQLAAFNSSQKDIHVTYESQGVLEPKLLTAVASGKDVPDVVLWDRYQTSLYAPKGALSAIDDLVARDRVDLTDFFQQPLGEMRIEGKLYGLPMLVDNRSLLYNKTILDGAGISPPSTWDEIAAAAAELTQYSGGKLTRSGFAIDDVGLFNMYIMQAGGKMLSSDKKSVAFDSAAGMAVLDYWSELVSQKKVYQVGFAQGIDGFGTGAIALKYDGPWNMPTYDAVSGFEYGVVAPATGPGGDKGAITGGFGLVIPTAAKNRDAAWEFMKWWCTVPANAVGFSKISSWLPGSIKATQDPYFSTGHWPAFVQTMDFATVRPNTPGYSDVEGKALDPQLQNFLAGHTGAQSALATAASQGNQILTQNL